MNTPPTSLLDAQVPQVTIIVKVPNIAIKYPMTNGQVTSIPIQAFLAHNLSD